jgi:excisionase family DNA binding protein
VAVTAKDGSFKAALDVHPQLLKSQTMNSSNTPSLSEMDAPENYCGTSYAAKLLGLSVGTVQTLVEKHELKAWKTQGGHRRISIQSIHDFHHKNKMVPPHHGPQPDVRLRVLLVEDDDITREMLRGICDRASLPVDCTAMSSGMEALIDIASIQPHVLITDLDMPGLDGFELLRILGLNPQFENMAILVLSGLTADEVQARGGLPEGCHFMRKPVKADWFNGFFTGVMVGATRKPKPR